MGAPSFINPVHAAQLTGVSDTISDSNLGDAAKHTISFTATDSIQPSETIKITLDPSNSNPGGSSSFSEIGSTATSSDIFLSAGATNYAVVASCTSGNQATAAANYNNGTDENLTLTICSGAAVIATSSVVSVVVGSTTPLWSNPSLTGSYVIRVAGTMPNSGDTRVAILQNITVTASVDTSFTFTVSGMATTTSFNGITTTGSSTATALPFNTLVPNASSTLGQTLTVATNAKNGFAVTVQENQDLLSSTGATIHLFANGGASSTPAAWIPPENVLNDPQTYGHFGVSSDDIDEGAGEFNGGPKYVGNFATPREIFSNTGPADGTTQNIGLAHIFYTIEVGSLQPAGDDYTNTLTYVATPTY